MLFDIMDRRNSMIRKIMGNNKADPGTFSFLEPGWWALHAAAISGLYILAKRAGRNDCY
ncbi:MAG: hypothetical protein GXZ09_01355 [Syntrophomonadaceae bacterium]|nr:hypothetical protein [Syntrophomonadaceae bacterium]